MAKKEFSKDMNLANTQGNLLFHDELMLKLPELETQVQVSLQPVSKLLLRLRVERTKNFSSSSTLTNEVTPISLVEVCHVSYSDLHLQHQFTVIHEDKYWSEISIRNGGHFDYPSENENQKRKDALKLCFVPIDMQATLNHYIEDLQLKHDEFKELIEGLSSFYPAHY